MRPRGHLIPLLPKPPLPKVPDQCSRKVAHRAQQGTAAGPLRPCRFHPAPRAFVADFTQQESHLRPVVPHHRRHCAGDCGRPPASRRGDRFPQRASHLGADPPASSAHSLRDPLWWPIARSPALGPPSLPFLPARGRNPPRHSWQVRQRLEGRLSSRQAGVSGQPPSLAAEKAFAAFLRPLLRKEWVVCSKRPFGGPEYVLHYLARYTHRVAISNHRLLSVADGNVTFRWKDYAHGSKQRKMTII